VRLDNGGGALAELRRRARVIEIEAVFELERVPRAIIEAHGFTKIRHGATSHRRYRAVIGGSERLVDVTPHNLNSDIPIGTLKAMIRQSGLPQHLFRK
jgi:predicted RNA binding protein YcfA (HicA-like mRNA interferase family)